MSEWADHEPKTSDSDVSNLLDYINPTRFLALAARALPWLSLAAAALLGVGLYAAFFLVPPDYQQGETVRIMYVHVPAAITSMIAYVVMTSASLGVLVWRHPLADAAQKAAAPLGASFTAICLITGSLWGKPMWGTFWVWDARLTSYLVLLLIYFGIIAIRQTMDDTPRGARVAAIMTIVGAIDLPIIKFSVEWWNTLHQPASVFRVDGPAIAPSMLWPLLVMTLGAALLFLTLHFMALRNEILRRRVERLTLQAVRADEGDALEART
jgi:heme exporter protein C